MNLHTDMRSFVSVACVLPLSRHYTTRVKYATGDLETLNIDELILDKHIYVRKQ